MTEAAPAPASLAAQGGQVDRDNPWPGLPSFREQDQAFFFGREDEIEELRRTVMRESTRATVVYGRSGLGKTSLLQAGLFPRLRRQEVLPVAIRLAWAGERGPAERGLVDQVRDAILAAAADARVEAPPLPPGETLWESLHRAGANFWSAANRIVVPLLVFDQFEEIFTLGRKDPGREAFLAELADLVEGRPPAAVKARLDAAPALAADFSPERHDYKILVCLRQDFLADLDTLRARMRSLGASRLALRHMTGEAALRVVTCAGGHLIAPEVAEKVVRFVSGAGRAQAGGADGAGAAAAEHEETAGAGGAAAERQGLAGRQAGADGPPPLAELTVDPTLLSLVCRELNNRRRDRGEATITFDLLSGSWKEILTRFYEASLAGLTPEMRTFIEDRLLTRSGYRDSVAWDNAVAVPGVTAAALLTLRDRRLLRIEERHGVDWVELTHDVLTEVIGESRELRRQREARRQAEEDAREADRLAQQAGERERETRRLLARSRKLALVLGWVLVATVVLAIAAAVLWRHSQAAEKAADSAQRRAERALFDSAGNLIEKGRAAQALAYLASIMRSRPEDSDDARHRALGILLHESWPLPVLRVRHDRAVTAAELSPDGERLLTASLDGTARLWRVRDGAPLAVMRHGGAATSAAFSPDGDRVLTGCQDGVARIWDGRSGAPLGREMKVYPPVDGVAWSSRGDRLMISSYEGTTLWDARTQERLTPPYHVAALSPDGKRFAATGNTVIGEPPLLVVLPTAEAPLLFDRRAGAARGELSSLGKDATLVAFNHRGDRLLTVGAQGTVRIADLTTLRVVSTHDHKAPVTWAEFSPDDHTLLTVCADRVVRLWNLDAPGSPPRPIPHDRLVSTAHFSPDGRWVLTGSRDSAAWLWDARTGETAMQALRHKGPVNVVGWSRDGRKAVSAADDGTAEIWDMRPDRYARPQLLAQPVRYALFGSRGAEAIAVTQDGTVRLWDLATGESSVVSPGGLPVLSANLLADGRLAVVAADPQRNTLQAWDARTGRSLSAVIKVPQVRELSSAQVSADGERLLALGPWWAVGWQIQSWDARSGKEIPATRQLDDKRPEIDDEGRFVLTWAKSGLQVWATQTGRMVGHVELANPIVGLWSPHARLIAILAADHVLRFFAPSGKPTGSSVPFDSGFQTLSFSQDATRMIATLGRGEVEVREIANGRLLCRIQLASQVYPPVAETPFVAELSADGQRFLARSADGFAQVWDVDSCHQLAEPLWHAPPQGWVTRATFSPDGSRVMTVDNDGTVRVWDQPETSSADSTALADLAEAVGGFAVDDAGNAVPVDHPVERLARLRASAARPAGMSNLAGQVVRWFFADPGTLTLSPFSTIKISAAQAAQAPAPAAGASP